VIWSGLTHLRRPSLQFAERRIRQVRTHTFAGNHAVEIPSTLSRLLLPGIETRFRTLRTSDQQHLIDVAGSLSRNGAGEDLVAAGLLHDIGKAAPGITIRLTDRVAKVLLEYLAPGAIASLALRERPRRFESALWVLARHAHSGSDIARRAGYNERVQWLIANHERRDLIDNPDLRRLFAADESGDRRPAR